MLFDYVYVRTFFLYLFWIYALYGILKFFNFLFYTDYELTVGISEIARYFFQNNFLDYLGQHFGTIL